MAERKSPAGGADFVAKIVKDPKNPPATLMLTGYLGASSEDGHTRLYFDPHLSNYAEIPNDAILHTQDAAAGDGLGATNVWIKRDAVLIYGPTASQRPKGTFLEGPIMQDHMAGAAAAAGAGVAFPVTRPPVCGISLPIVCQLTPFCPPSVQPCISLPVICNVPLRTVAPPCFPRTVADPGCLVSAQFACPTVGACPSIACNPGGPGGGNPVMEQARMASAVQVCVTQQFHCQPTQQNQNCPSVVEWCHSIIDTCPTEDIRCPGFPTHVCQAVTMRCPIPSAGCGGGGGGTPVMALSTMWAYCTQVCHPGGGGTPVMAAPTLWANCTQACGPSFLGMGCGTGGTLPMAHISQQCTNHCLHPSIADNSCPR